MLAVFDVRVSRLESLVDGVPFGALTMLLCEWMISHIRKRKADFPCEFFYGEPERKTMLNRQFRTLALKDVYNLHR